MPSLRSILWIALAMLLSTPSPAQFTTASLGGTVTDPSGAVIADAHVTARNVDTGLTQSATTGSAGAFIIPRLPVGHYELTVEKPGFAAYIQSGITLVVNQAATVTVSLQLSQLTNQVTISGEPRNWSTREPQRADRL